MDISNKTSDHLLVAALKRGNDRAFDALYQKYYPKVFNFLRRMYHSPETAEDLAHEVFMKIWVTRYELDPDKCFSSFLFTIARNGLFNYTRKQVISQQYLKKIKPQAADEPTETAVIFADYLAFFEKVIRALPPQKKRIFLLTYQEGKTYKEVADELKISKKTVEFHLRDCLKTLRHQFKLHTDIIIGLLLCCAFY